MLDNLISDLEKYLKISLVKEESANHTKYLLTLNDSTEIWFEQTPLGIFIHSKICHFNEKELSSPEDFYIYLSKANYLGQGTGNSIISIDPDEKFLTLSTRIAYEVNYRMFRDLIEEFVNYLSFWKKEVNKKVRVDK
jgi:hypothetical protein